MFWWIAVGLVISYCVIMAILGAGLPAGYYNRSFRKDDEQIDTI